MSDNNPMNTAISMVRKYGYVRAEEYAYGYGHSLYWDSSAAARLYWDDVVDAIKQLRKEGWK